MAKILLKFNSYNLFKLKKGNVSSCVNQFKKKSIRNLHSIFSTFLLVENTNSTPWFYNPRSDVPHCLCAENTNSTPWFYNHFRKSENERYTSFCSIEPQTFFLYNTHSNRVMVERYLSFAS